MIWESRPFFFNQGDGPARVTPQPREIPLDFLRSPAWAAIRALVHVPGPVNHRVVIDRVASRDPLCLISVPPATDRFSNPSTHRTPKRGRGLVRACKAGDYLQGLPRSDAVQIFGARAKHTLLLADRARHGWSETTACRLCGEREETISHVLSECREVVGDPTSGWPAMPVNEILWCGDRQKYDVYDDGADDDGDDDGADDGGDEDDGDDDNGGGDDEDDNDDDDCYGVIMNSFVTVLDNNFTLAINILVFLHLESSYASLQEGHLRLLGPPSGQGADGGARTRDRGIPADIRADSVASVPSTLPFFVIIVSKFHKAGYSSLSLLESHAHIFTGDCLDSVQGKEFCCGFRKYTEWLELKQLSNLFESFILYSENSDAASPKAETETGQQNYGNSEFPRSCCCQDIEPKYCTKQLCLPLRLLVFIFGYVLIHNLEGPVTVSDVCLPTTDAQRVSSISSRLQEDNFTSIRRPLAAVQTFSYDLSHFVVCNKQTQPFCADASNGSKTVCESEIIINDIKPTEKEDSNSSYQDSHNSVISLDFGQKLQ
ncbi:hypothetical protein PoB_003362600 [Plakobranchus ocellatus]|uniref:Reverse transcriptase zinc-binding domain-containing protein n=1 Tax=Plakobranchus ocellatus TaxID=259542 RepID=A0AAV4A7C1_9GAST|nr:hypothetical protein PoB_003362600 [Plakobranchus ocellatus]